MKTKVKLLGAVAIFAIALGVNASIGMTTVQETQLFLTWLMLTKLMLSVHRIPSHMDTVCMQLRYVSLIQKKKSVTLIQCKNLR